MILLVISVLLAVRGGLDLAGIKRVNLVIAAGTSVLLFLHWRRVRWTADRTLFDGFLALVAVFSGLVWLNFFSFHGERTFVHLHDVAHYYLASKYQAELRYADLYTAMLRAEAEDREGRLTATEARDLRTYEIVPARRLLAQSGTVKDGFHPTRWKAFRNDAAWFRERLMPGQYAGLLKDHGFNATPVWSIAGTALARLVPAGSGVGILLLTLIDPLLLAGMFAAVGWGFGRRAMLLAMIHFFVIFGATFGWTGGAFLRYPWLAALVTATCCLRRGHHFAAGALLALSSLLRVFPAFFVVPLLLKGLTVLRRRRAVAARRTVVLFGSYAVTALLLIAATAALPRGAGSWSEFSTNLGVHADATAPNLVGMTGALAWKAGPQKVTREEFQAIEARRNRIHAIQIVVLFVPMLTLVALLSRRLGVASAVWLGLPLLLVALNLAAYYYAALVILVLVNRRHPRNLALIFAAEAASYTLLLLEDRDALLHVYRSLMLFVLFALLLVGPVRRALRPVVAGEGP